MIPVHMHTQTGSALLCANEHGACSCYLTSGVLSFASGLTGWQVGFKQTNWMHEILMLNAAFIQRLEASYALCVLPQKGWIRIGTGW